LAQKNSAANLGRKMSKEFCEERRKHRKTQFPPYACKYLLLDLQRIEYIVHGGLKAFVKEHNLSQSLFQRFIDKGTIVTRQSIEKQSDQIKNSLGWEIRRIKDHAEEENSQK
jgi:hypothetical protein